MHALARYALLICVGSLSLACADDAGLEGEEGEIQLPTSIVHVIEGATQVYSVTGIYLQPGKDDPQELSKSFLGHLERNGFEDALSADFDTKARSFRITSRKPIPGSLLREAINSEARLWGVLPYWTELQSRDLSKAPDYSTKAFKLLKVSGKWPESLAWFGAGEEPLRLPFRFDLFRWGTVFISRTTAYCMCHNRFSIRILDERDRVIWETDQFAQGTLRFALASLRQNGELGIHDLLVDVNDHGFKKAHYRVVREIGQK